MYRQIINVYFWRIGICDGRIVLGPLSDNTEDEMMKVTKFLSGQPFSSPESDISRTGINEVIYFGYVRRCIWFLCDNTQLIPWYRQILV
jgi:hypothetical protein